MTTDLAKRTNAVELARVFQAAAADIRTAFALVCAAEERLNAAFTLGGHGNMTVTAGPSGHRENFNDPQAAIDRLSRKAWRRIAERLELPRVMSIKRWEELEKEILTGKSLPDVTEENVTAFAAQHLRSLPSVHEEAVREIFDWLRPRKGTDASGYKRNSQFEIGVRVAIPRMVSCGIRIYRVTEEHKLRALENVFRALDGKGWTGSGYRSDLQNAIEASVDGCGATEYFEFRCYKNESLHIRFLRPDLVAKINRMAGGVRLRPGKRERACE